MQDYLHMRTLSFLTSIIGLIIFLCMLYVSRTRKTYPGFHHWTAAMLCYFLGMILIGLRNVLPHFISIVVSNGLLIATTCLLGSGIATFADLRHKMWLYACPIVLIMLAASHFTYYAPNSNARIVIFSAILALCSIYCVVLIHRSIPPFLHSSNLLLEVSLSSGALWSVFRSIYTLFFERGAVDFMLSSSVQGASLLVYSLVFISSCFGLYVLNSQRVEYDLLKARDEVKALKGIIPICSSCKKIRDDKGYWTQVESYIRTHSEAEFSHSICPECVKKLYPDLAE
jgi:hypothetical protein